MSSYLHRLVSFAMGPATGVHPVVTPLYASPEYRNGKERITEQGPAVPDVPARIVPQEGAVSELPDRQGDLEASLRFLREDAVSGLLGRKGSLDAALQSYVPITAPRIDTPMDDFSPQGVTHPTAQAPEESVSAREESAAESSGISRNQSPYRRFLSELSREISPLQSDLRSASSTTAAPRTRRERSDKSSSNGGEKYGPDEIQITIGRIEVTAVPESPRPAVRPTHKHFSLDDYLKRADARSR